MTNTPDDMQALAAALDQFTQTTRTLEETYRLLKARVRELDKELAAKNRELALTSDYLNSILDSMSDGVVAIDTAGTVTTFNRAAGHVLGFTAEEVVGRPFREIFGREFPAPPGRHVMELRARDGRRTPVTEADAPISDRTGRHIGTVKVFQDLSEIEALREKVRRQDRLAALGQLAATVAHEIRNPLGGIHGFAALLARDIQDGDPRGRLVEKILAGTKELERVVSELLEYTRPMELRLRLIPCRDLIEGTLGYVQASPSEQVARPSLEFRNEVAAELSVMADPDKIRQALLNILLNAAQSIERAGAIRIRSAMDDHSVTISVADTGCGMSPEQIKQVFTPFFTTKEKGTGLGLAVAAKIIEAHGGSIDVESAPGIGSTFFLRFPKPGAAGPVGPSSSSAPAQPLAYEDSDGASTNSGR